MLDLFKREQVNKMIKTMTQTEIMTALGSLACGLGVVFLIFLGMYDSYKEGFGDGLKKGRK